MWEEQTNSQVRFRWRIKKLNTHKGVVVDILLDSGAIGLFIDPKFVREQEFKLNRLEWAILVRVKDSGLDLFFLIFIFIFIYSSYFELRVRGYQ